MKKLISIICAALITAALLLTAVSCNKTTAEQTPEQTAEQTSPAATDALTPTPLQPAPETPQNPQTSPAPPAQTAAPEQEPPPPPEPFAFTPENMPVIDGSTATIPLIEAVCSVLLGLPRAEAATKVSTSGTDAAYEKLISGEAGILLVYAPSPDVYEIAKYHEVELELAPIGRDGLVFLVNKANPVETLTPEQLVSIYRGQARNWRDVGGEDAAITAFQRPYRSGSQTLMDELVMKGAMMAQTQAEYVIGEMGGLVEAVAMYDNARSAIGYNVYYFVSKMEMNENVRLLAVDGVHPTTQSISDGTYPFVSDFYAVIRTDAPADSPERILYNWMQSDDGQNLVKHEGYATR